MSRRKAGPLPDRVSGDLGPVLRRGEGLGVLDDRVPLVGHKPLGVEKDMAPDHVGLGEALGRLAGGALQLGQLRPRLLDLFVDPG